MPSSNHITKKLLTFAGLKLQRRPKVLSELQAYPETATSGKILEFIGTQGIGKSRLCYGIHRQTRHFWFNRHDIPRTAPKQSACPSIEAAHQSILLKRIQRLDASRSVGWGVIGRCRQLSAVAYESLIISTLYFPKGFILDEGLFKTFPEEVLELPHDEASALWSSRAFVYLRSKDPYTVAARFSERAARRVPDFLRTRESDQAIIARVERDNNVFDAMAARAEELGNPVITVWAEDRFSDTLEIVLEFERSLRSERLP